MLANRETHADKSEKIWNLEFEIWNLESGIWNLEFEI